MPIARRPVSPIATMTAALASLSLLLAAPARAEDATQPEAIGFAMLIAGAEQMRWTIGADGSGEAQLLHSRPGEADAERQNGVERIALRVSADDYRWAVAQIARYRQFALAAPGCAITPEGVMAFRLSWREQGQTHVASFSDNCGGVPTDFFETVRPLGQRMEGWQVREPAATPP